MNWLFIILYVIIGIICSLVVAKLDFLSSHSDNTDDFVYENIGLCAFSIIIWPIVIVLLLIYSIMELYKKLIILVLNTNFRKKGKEDNE